MPTPALNPRGFAAVDLLALLAATGAVAAMALTGLSRARTLAGAVTSADNLRTLHAAHAAYEADWNGRQLTFVADDISTYGSGISEAFDEYNRDNEPPHPGVALGWGRLFPDEDRYFWLAYSTRINCANAALTLPIIFEGSGCNNDLAGYGSFRLFNAQQFNQYLGGRFYDDVFYAPNDEVVIDAIDAGGCFDTNEGFCRFADVESNVGDIPAWSSYCLSPAAMLDPAVMARDDPDDEELNGWVDPWTLDEGFTSPSPSQALYPDLKTFILEHHWLQNNPGKTCNPGFDPGTYGGCEPYYFNHAFASAPITLFYDGHVAEVSIAQAIADDAFVRDENDGNWGLWSQDTPFGQSGYYSDFAWDTARTSMHVLTTDGIRGRDVLEVGARGLARPRTLRPPRPVTDPRRADETRPAPRIRLTAE